jgi:hypothetical protein
MYTSCGWFFAEISGLEAVQVLKYAGRALDLLAELDVRPHRDAFLEVLADAKSNLPAMGNGADVFRRLVDPCRVTPHGVAAHQAIAALVEDDHEEVGEAGGWRYQASASTKQQHGRVTLYTARVKLDALTTQRKVDCAVAAMHFGGADFYCAVRQYPGDDLFASSVGALWSLFRTASLPTLLRAAQDCFGPEEFGLDGILPDARERISGNVFRGLVRRFSEQYAALYQDNRRTLEMLQSAGLALPAELRAAAEFTLGRRFEEAILQQHQSTDPAAYRKAIEIAEEIALGGYQIDRTLSRQIFSSMITEAVWTALEHPDSEDLESALVLLELTRRLGIDADLTKAQEAVYERRGRIPAGSKLLRLAGPLNIAAGVLGG